MTICVNLPIFSFEMFVVACSLSQLNITFTGHSFVLFYFYRTKSHFCLLKRFIICTSLSLYWQSSMWPSVFSLCYLEGQGWVYSALVWWCFFFCVLALFHYTYFPCGTDTTMERLGRCYCKGSSWYGTRWACFSLCSVHTGKLKII